VSLGRFGSGPTISIITIHTHKTQTTTTVEAMDGSQARRLLTGSRRTQRRSELIGRSSALGGSDRLTC
jgi:hypothetical protein